MELFVFTFAGLCLAFAAMALGVLMGRPPLVRGCGGAEAEACRVCTRPCPRRTADPVGGGAAMKGVGEAKARDYMSTRLVTLQPERDVLGAMQTLLDEQISGAPVVDSRGSLLGILTQRDCMRVALQAAYHQEPAGPVADYMSSPVDTVSASASLIELIEAFSQSRYRRFPVMDGNRLVGQISRRDILRAILELW